MKKLYQGCVANRRGQSYRNLQVCLRQHTEFTSPFWTANQINTFCITEVREREICMFPEKDTHMFPLWQLMLSCSTTYAWIWGFGEFSYQDSDEVQLWEALLGCLVTASHLLLEEYLTPQGDSRGADGKDRQPEVQTVGMVMPSLR